MNIFGISRDPNTLRYIKTMQKDVLCVSPQCFRGIGCIRDAKSRMQDR